MAELSDEEVAEINDFFNSPTATRLFGDLQNGILSEWSGCSDRERRDQLWHLLQAVLHLKATLRDAAPMKRLNLRNQERKVSPN